MILSTRIKINISPKTLIYIFSYSYFCFVTKHCVLHKQKQKITYLSTNALEDTIEKHLIVIWASSSYTHMYFLFIVKYTRWREVGLLPMANQTQKSHYLTIMLFQWLSKSNLKLSTVATLTIFNDSYIIEHSTCSQLYKKRNWF